MTTTTKGGKATKRLMAVPIEPPEPGSQLRKDLGYVSGSRRYLRVGRSNRRSNVLVTEFKDRGNNNRVLERRRTLDADGRVVADSWSLLTDHPLNVAPGDTIEGRYTMTEKKKTTKATTTKTTSKKSANGKAKVFTLEGHPARQMARWIGANTDLTGKELFFGFENGIMESSNPTSNPRQALVENLRVGRVGAEKWGSPCELNGTESRHVLSVCKKAKAAYKKEHPESKPAPKKAARKGNGKATPKKNATPKAKAKPRRKPSQIAKQIAAS